MPSGLSVPAGRVASRGVYIFIKLPLGNFPYFFWPPNFVPDVFEADSQRPDDANDAPSLTVLISCQTELRIVLLLESEEISLPAFSAAETAFFAMSISRLFFRFQHYEPQSSPQ